MPDEATRALRRRLGRRVQLVRQRTRAKNEVPRGAAAPARRATPGERRVRDQRPAWLERLVLPEDERETLEACLRPVDFLDAEVAEIERSLAPLVLGSADMRRLMTVPGVSATTAATLIAAIGDIGRFPAPRRLVGYLGLDPRVRQSGSDPAHHGRITKQGASGPATRSSRRAGASTRTAGPLRAVLPARRGPPRLEQVAIVAARASSRACSGACSPAARTTPSPAGPARAKLRELELRAGSWCRWSSISAWPRPRPSAS